MAATVQDVLKANVVLVGIELLDTESALKDFRTQVVSEVVGESMLLPQGLGGAPMKGTIFKLSRDRITLECSGIRSSVNREYPSKADLARLAAVTRMATASTHLGGRSPQAFGFNVELVFSQTSTETALRYLSRRMFAPAFSTHDAWTLVGGTGKLIYQSSGRRCTVSFEPRFNEETTARVFVYLNLHVSDSRLPDESEILTYLEDTWNEAHNFVEKMDHYAASA